MRSTLTTIAKDIAALQQFGIDIVTIHSTQCKYFIGSRQFELPELKLLIDAVESSKFITSKKSLFSAAFQNNLQHNSNHHSKPNDTG